MPPSTTTTTRPPRASTSSSSPSSPTQSLAPVASSSSSTGHSSSSNLFPSTTSYAHSPQLTHYLQTSFVNSVAPEQAEYTAKEQARQYLETLAGTVSPGAKLLPFGSMANGFALKNSDMDLCCLLAKDAPSRNPAELVELLGRLIEQETNFHVKMLPRARIPIIKLTMPPTATVPFGMACDIGFENRLALENTRLLLTYAMVDHRVRPLVLFLKVWTKRRKINNPYRGTLSSYGFVLLVIHFLTHVKQPPVLPNLQRLPPLRPIPLEELEFDGHDISFFDDLDSLPLVWQTSNMDNVGELLIDFFRYFSKDFQYNSAVIAIRSELGVVTKDSKGWHTDFEFDPEIIVRDLHKLCIEDPFQLDYNVARTVTRDGLYTIRGEFMRAFRLLSGRTPDRIGTVVNEVCEEREDYLVQHPPSTHPSPRRRSAPSPRMMPTPGGALPPPLPTQMSDFRLWAAMNGVVPNGASATSGGGGGGGGGAGGGLRMGNSPFGKGDNSSSSASASGSTVTESTGGEEPWDSTSATTFPTTSYNYSGAAPRRPPHYQSYQSPHPHPSHVYGGRAPPPASIGIPSLERRVSWDGSGASTTPTPGATSVAGGPASAGATGYDLHRFFQNQPGDNPVHLVEPRSAVTAPSSPDLGSSMYYSHNQGFFGGPGRSPYRYNGAPAGYPAPARHGASLPRIGATTALRHLPPFGGYASVAPAPIFPEEDREAIALANSITFGNFASNGPSSYGSTSSAFSMRAAEEDDEAAAAAAEFDEGEEGEAGRLSARGRRLKGILLPRDDLAYLGGGGVGGQRSRQRGRSVPHVRVGADGRESILFGEIQVVLPRPAVDDDEEERRREEAAVAALEQQQPPQESTLATVEAGKEQQSPVPVPNHIIPVLTTQPPTPLKPTSASTKSVTTPPTPRSPDIIPLSLSSPPLTNGWVGVDNSPSSPSRRTPLSPASTPLPVSPIISNPTSPTFAAVRSPNGTPTTPVKKLTGAITKLKLDDVPSSTVVREVVDEEEEEEENRPRRPSDATGGRKGRKESL